MRTSVLEIDPDTLTRPARPLDADRALRVKSVPALLARAHETLEKTLSSDPVEFLTLHRQRDGE